MQLIYVGYELVRGAGLRWPVDNGYLIFRCLDLKYVTCA